MDTFLKLIFTAPSRCCRGIAYYNYYFLDVYSIHLFHYFPYVDKYFYYVVMFCLVFLPPRKIRACMSGLSLHHGTLNTGKLELT